MAKQVAAVSGLQRYRAYKPSGVEWLGEVPAHWDVVPLKFGATCSSGDQLGGDLSDTLRSEFGLQIPVIGGNGRMGYSSVGNVRVPTIAVGRVGAQCGNVHVVDPPAWITDNALMLEIQSQALEVRYVSKVLRVRNLNDLANQSAQPLITGTQVRAQRLPVPPLSEQAAIARYLDHADRRIRRCIQAKEKLVKLLEEQRQALVNEAVTGRVDVRTREPYPAYKPSGVKWLGDVPSHWEVRQLGRMGTLSKGNGGSKADEEPVGVPCVRYGDLYTTHTRFISSSRAFVSRARAAEYTPVNHGDVLFAASGETIDEIGKSAVNLILSEACCGGDIIVFRPKHRMHAPFMGYVTDCWSSANQKATMGRGFTVVHIYATQLKQLVLPIPPLSEQTAIARYLDHADRRIRRYVESAQRQIHLLNEYRTRLIADVVTGKLDVRETASELANDREEFEVITGLDDSASTSGKSAHNANVVTQASEA